MSIRTIQAVIDHSPQPPHLKFLLILIANSENEGSGRCDPGLDKLAFYMNCTERNLQRKLRDINRKTGVKTGLVESGELVIERRPGRSHQYYIPLYPNEPGYYNPGECTMRDSHECNGYHGPLVNRASVALDLNPRWNRKKTAPSDDTGVNHSSGVTPAQGVNHSSPRGEPQFTPPRTTVHPRGEPQFTLTGIEPEVEPEVNRARARVHTTLSKTDTRSPAPKREAPPYDAWVAGLSLNEQAHYELRPKLGRQNYMLYYRERGMEPQP